MTTTRTRVRNGLINTGMVAISFSLPFLLLECALRGQSAPDIFFDDSYDGVAGIGMPVADPLDVTWDADGNSPVHVRSDNPILVYEIRPNLTIYEDRIRTNSLGFRGPEVSIEKPDGVFRICVIGDSITFGWAEREEDTFPYLMQQYLAESHAPDGRRFEVINMGVGGYNAEQELEILRERALPLNPDLILVQYCANDAEVGADSGLWHHFTTTGSPAADFVRLRFMQARELFRIRDLVERSYLEMAEVAQFAGIPIAFLFFHPYKQNGINHDYRRHIAFVREHGWPVLSLYDAYEATGDWNALMKGDPYHPSPEGYALAAREIVRFLEANHFFAAEPAPG